MIVAIPLSRGIKPAPETIGALVNSGYGYTLVCSGKTWAGRHTLPGMDNICDARNACFPVMRNHDYSIMLDGDCIVDPELFCAMESFLINNPKYLFIALSPEKINTPEPAYLDGGCFMFRKEFFNTGIVFHHDGFDSEWAHLCLDAHDLGWKYRYLSIEKQIIDLHLFKEAT
jgi:hypothetical protein